VPDKIFGEISSLHDEGWDPLAPNRCVRRLNSAESLANPNLEQA
jgi:hypothetical protein